MAGDQAVPAAHQGPRSRRRRWLIGAVVAVVVLFLLAWAADALARRAAESLLAARLQSAIGATEAPAVDIGGPVFLTQVVRGVYTRADVTTRGITRGPIRVEQVDSQLSDIRVPFRDLVTQDIRRVDVGRSVEDVTLLYADLNAYLAATDRPLRLTSAGGDDVRVAGAVEVLDRQVQAAATVDLALTGDRLQVTPEVIEVGLEGLDRTGRVELEDRLTFPVPLRTLPFGHELTRVEPYADGLRLRAEGTDIVIEP